MSSHYQAVGWNHQKIRYDLTLALGVLLYAGAYAGATLIREPAVTVETLVIRATGSLAFVLLTLVLCVGPLARLDPRFLPLLYNRRHAGVAMFILALGHGVFSVVQFHALGDLNPIVSVLSGDGDFRSFGRFPFQPFGLAALCLLALLATSSHDFWLANLTPRVWKALHMLVYGAYGLAVVHLAFGPLQGDAGTAIGLMAIGGLGAVVILHAAAAVREARIDRELAVARTDDFVDACGLEDIPEKRARVVVLNGERVAVFKYDGRVSCVSNVCRHQMGPLGEGKILDGCITCPWHGYQYLPDSGRSPPPFTERIETYRVKIAGDRVLVDPRANPPGTLVEPATFSLQSTADAQVPTPPRHERANAQIP
jgi:nitrite reductase/ring-hydroxylating ferredoxin subunit/DMSO/TMAO reductase YedYZ heme-binding membrane subunit